MNSRDVPARRADDDPLGGEVGPSAVKVARRHAQLAPDGEYLEALERRALAGVPAMIAEVLTVPELWEGAGPHITAMARLALEHRRSRIRETFAELKEVERVPGGRAPGLVYRTELRAALRAHVEAARRYVAMLVALEADDVVEFSEEAGTTSEEESK